MQGVDADQNQRLSPLEFEKFIKSPEVQGIKHFNFR